MCIHWSVILHYQCYAAAGTSSFLFRKFTVLLPRRGMSLSQHLKNNSMPTMPFLDPGCAICCDIPKMFVDSSGFGAASSPGPALANTGILTDVSVCTEECFVIHTIPVALSWSPAACSRVFTVSFHVVSCDVLLLMARVGSYHPTLCPGFLSRRPLEIF